MGFKARRSLSGQLQRQWRILRRLNDGELSVSELAHELEVTKTTVQRDLETLETVFALSRRQDEHHTQREYRTLKKRVLR